MIVLLRPSATPLVIGCAMLLLPHRVHRLRHLPHDVEAIEHDLGVAVRQPCPGRADVRLPHVHGDGVQRSLLSLGQLA